MSSKSIGHVLSTSQKRIRKSQSVGTQYKTNINILVDCNPVIAAAKPTYHNHSVVYRYN